MNDNEPKKGAVKKFIIEHRIDLTIGACLITSAAVLCGVSYKMGRFSGRIDQYNIDAKGFTKQLNQAAKILDDDAKTAFVDAFNAAASTSSK